MKIAGYLRTSLIEWPGKISSVIFIPGCNFYCPFCHNADLVKPKVKTKLPLIAETEVLADLKKRKKWIDGVVVTGGEPTLQPDLDRFLQQCQKLGFETMVETNGSKPEIIDRLLKSSAVDYLSVDVKTTLDKNYAKAVGLKKYDPSVVVETIKLLKKSKIPFELRTTVVPEIHDKKTLIKMAKQLKRVIGRKKIPWFWQNFQAKNCLDPKFNKKEPFKKETLKGFLEIVKKHYSEVRIREGID